MPVTDTLSLSKVEKPTSQDDVVEILRRAFEKSEAVYPLGGQTALDYGFHLKPHGVGIHLTGLARVVDYTPRDMTILVDAGIRMADLERLLAAENQQLPIDVPCATDATLGGVIATNWTGPRRYGHGTIRDYVIGIHAVDGRGVAFQGGGRVVKNVAGYDLCKLLCGSLGTLAVITQVALKLKPRPETSATVVAACADLATTEILLERLVGLPSPPAAIDYLAGNAWMIPASTGDPQSEIRSNTPHLVIRMEGSAGEVDYLADQAQYELWQGGGMNVARLAVEDAQPLWSQQIEFAARGMSAATPDNSPLAIRFAVPPSAATKMIAAVHNHDSNCAIQAHVGSGVVVARFAEFKTADITKVLVGKLRPLAIQNGGNLVVLSTTLEGLTLHDIWGPRTEATVLAERIKQKFDPRSILNLDRFAYH